MPDLVDAVIAALLTPEPEPAGRQAYRILETADTDTPPEIVCWAAGVIAGSHADRFAGRDTVTGEELAGVAGHHWAGGHNREFFCTKAGLRVTKWCQSSSCTHPERDRRWDHTVVNVRWRDAAAMVRPDHITPAMRAEIEDASTSLMLLKLFEPDYPEQGWVNRWDDPEYRAYWDRLRAAMRRAEQAGSAVWRAARPAALIADWQTSNLGQTDLTTKSV